MYSIQLMMDEHENILKLIAAMKRACIGIADGKEVVVKDFENMILFARNYADKHHHGKEEQILFKEMLDHLGHIGENLIRHGMLVEHDLGRLHIGELEAALMAYSENPSTEYKIEIIANAVGYANLLKRHIDKEDEIIYTYAKEKLSGDILESVDLRTKKFEDEATELNIQNKYLKILEDILAKY